MRTLVSLLSSIALSGAAMSAHADHHSQPEGWLFDDVASDSERFEKLQDYLGGFSSAMWEVGERYRVLHDALGRENYDLALYHWGKVRDAIIAGYTKRPGRQENSDKLFLDAVWGEVNEALSSRDSAKAWQGFRQARAACMACHEAEQVGFMNDQALFDLPAGDQ